MFDKIKKYGPVILTIYIAFVFIQSLFFKFTYSPETAYIFTTLDQWAAGFGFEGLFVPPGPFNAYVIGTAELIASLLLLTGMFLQKPLLQGFGALLSIGVISGAIFFHLFTPLGVDPMNDGGVLFGMAVGVWFASVGMLVLKKKALLSLLCPKHCRR